MKCRACGFEHEALRGAWVAFWRKEAGLSLVELGKRVKASPQHLNDIEHEKRTASPELHDRLVKELFRLAPQRVDW